MKLTKDRIRGAEMKEVRQTPQEDHLLTVVEAARFLNLAPGSLYHLISQRRIPVIRLSSRCVRFSRRALMEWVESLTHPQSCGDL